MTSPVAPRVAALLLLAACAGPLHAQTAPASAPAPRTATIPASLDAFESADLFAKDAGYLTAVKVDIGDHVKQGQVLAVIDDPELQKQWEIAQATLSARGEMAKAALAAVDQSQKSLEVLRSQRVGFEAESTLQQATLKRQEELFANKAITNQQLDEARAKAEVARAQSSVAAARVDAAETDIIVAQANAAVAKSQVAVAQAEANRLETLTQYTKVVAPFDGIITRRMVSRGDLVQSGAANRATPLFTCQRIDIIRVTCDIPESSAASVQTGNAASVKIPGLNNQVITGAVTRIGSSLNPATRTMRAEVDLPNPAEHLRPGMYGQVTITLSDLPPATGPAKP